MLIDFSTDYVLLDPTKAEGRLILRATEIPSFPVTGKEYKTSLAMEAFLEIEPEEGTVRLPCTKSWNFEDIRILNGQPGTRREWLIDSDVLKFLSANYVFFIRSAHIDDEDDGSEWEYCCMVVELVNQGDLGWHIGVWKNDHRSGDRPIRLCLPYFDPKLKGPSLHDLEMKEGTPSWRRLLDDTHVTD